MSLIGNVKTLCDRLAPLGWRDLLLAVTNNALDISQSTNAKLKTALTSPLATIDRTKKGFEDFQHAANQAITGGRPSHSLLYHALASPEVHPTSDEGSSTNQDDYPTLGELDLIENFIYSLVSDRTDLTDTFVAVFAYQYRVASRTSHLRHADLAYSRTGVARVGTTKSNYDASRRSFWVIPEGGGDALPVLPARYGVFLAKRAKPGTAGSVQGGHKGIRDDDFVFPAHKLFAGKECLKGQTLQVNVLEFHRNEKLRMTHRLPLSDGGLPIPPGFDITQLPYVRDSRNGGRLVSLRAVGSSVLVVPEPGVTLVRRVSQHNNVSHTNQLVHFIVPRSSRITKSTLTIPESRGDRLAPEYVNIRHEIDPVGPVTQEPKDLNTLSATAFDEAMRDGGHAAMHFTDDTSDGCVEAVVTGLPSVVENQNLPAFSLVTAPDFFPLADQLEVETDPSIIQVRPLSKGRLPANPSIPRPSNPTSFAFNRRDKTVTAVVGGVAFGPRTSIAGHRNRMVSFLPDAASDVFAPGWDTSRSRDLVGPFLTSSGLGSPFPEDAKLCAAIASFWPAVAPDNGRTFGNEPDAGNILPLDNQLPMLDEELGFHPNHDRVKSGELSSYLGWDGECGPFFEEENGKPHVNFVAIERSDYVSHALAGRIRVSLTAEVQSEDLIDRNQALEACERILIVGSNSEVCLVVFRKVGDWATSDRGRPELNGGGFLLEFAELKGNRRMTSEIERVRKEVKRRHVCHVGSNGIAYKNGGAHFTFAAS